MKFKLDENTPFILKGHIENVGDHQVDSVFHEKLTGIDDTSLNRKCFNNKQILITLDTDFINIMDPFFGIVILKPKTQGKNAVKSLFKKFLKSYPLKNVVGKIIIVEPNQVRIRS